MATKKLREIEEIKKEIEEPARNLNTMPVQQGIAQPQTQQIQTNPISQLQVQQPLNQPQSIPPPQQVPTPPVQPQFIPPQFQQAPGQMFDPRFQPPLNILQRVSEYGQKPSSAGLIITFVLIFFLLFLTGALIALFLFKDELSSIFGSLI
ncbi:hypothetical protein LCGC14_1613830 [marine sediment metagenome]|uniref:Uncharacterized protein n=1 Tax=marine sediment metagenome TaxID=412755 RepID=A0A0F9L7N5_9ZZZZ